MSGNNDSCLVQKLSQYIELTEVSRAQLAALEEEERNLPKHSEVHATGAPGEALYVVKNGWLYSYMDLPDGRRQIVKIHHPGDIVGFQDITLKVTTTTLRTAEAVCLCPFPKSKLDVIFRESPQLTALLFALAVREQTILVDTIRAIGRMSAREKIAFLLLELISRLRSVDKSIDSTIRMPLNQSEIADTIGLTNVYVSRTMQSLEDDGFIEREDDRITLKRESELVRMIDFDNRYAEIDTSWFPH